jgi:hypothetical protein
MLEEIAAPIEVRASANLGVNNIDVALARTRRVYMELIAQNRGLADRDVVLSINGISTLHPIDPHVEIFWKDDNQ